MVAQYENISDMIFDLITPFDNKYSSWDPGEESIQYHGQDLPPGKTLSSPKSKRYQQPEWSSS